MVLRRFAVRSSLLSRIIDSSGERMRVKGVRNSWLTLV